MLLHSITAVVVLMPVVDFAVVVGRRGRNDEPGRAGIDLPSIFTVVSYDAARDIETSGPQLEGAARRNFFGYIKTHSWARYLPSRLL